MEKANDREYLLCEVYNYLVELVMKRGLMLCKDNVWQCIRWALK